MSRRKINLNSGLVLRNSKGFTIVELIVAISVFTFVMFISTSSILTIFNVNRKSQSLRAVMDNLNYTLDSMTRTIRFGSKYHCDITVVPVSSPRDCASGASSISLTDSSGSQVIYRLNASHLERSTDGGNTYVALTSSDVTIATSTFRVFGSLPLSSNPPDKSQPQVIIVISGYAGSQSKSKTTFTLETTVSQRTIDSQ